jgi:hypothetical protein
MGLALNGYGPMVLDAMVLAVMMALYGDKSVIISSMEKPIAIERSLMGAGPM